MNSRILKTQKDSFILSCEEYLDVHRAVLSRIAEIESLMSSSIDTLSLGYIRSINEKLVKEIGKLDSEVSNSRSKVINTIDNKIAELESVERESAIKNKNRMRDKVEEI